MNAQFDDLAPAQARPDGSVGIGTVIRGVCRYPLLSVVTALAAVAGGAVVWLFLPLPKMTAYAIFHVSAQPQPLLTPVGDARTDFTLYRQAQAALVKSRPVLNAALNEPEMAGQNGFKNRPDPFAALENSLLVDFRISPELMRVSIEGDHAEEMLAVLEAVKRAYVHEVAHKDRAKRDDRFKQLETVQRRYGDELERYRTKLRKFAEGLGSGDPTSLALKERYLQEQISLAQRELFQLHSEMRRAQVETRTFDDKFRSLGPVSEEAVKMALRTDPTYQKLLAQQAAIREEMAEAKARTVPGSRLEGLVRREEQLERATKELDAYVEQASPEIAALMKEAMIAEGKRSLSSSQEHYVSLQNLEKAVDREIQALSEKLHALNIDQVSLEALRTEMSQTERTAERIQQELETMRPEFEAPARVTVWEEPTVVTGIEGNRRLKYSAVAGVGLLALGLCLITFLEYRNRRVVATRDVAENLGLRLIGTVPAVPVLPERGDPSADGRAARWRPVLTEYVDAARTFLVHNLAEPQPGRSVLITSAMPGEGKSVLACHLADSLVRAGYRALLVDGDLRRPAAHRMLNCPRGPGLCELLRGEVELLQALRPVGTAGLTLLPAGMWDARVSPALANGRWQRLQEQLKADFDYVVIDSSPLLLITDGLLLARHADAVVMSVLRHVSQIDAVDQACDRLRGLGAKLLGVVVSGVAGPAREVADSYYQPSPEPASAALLTDSPTE